MTALSSNISSSDSEYEQNYAAYEARIFDLYERRKLAHAGGSETARKRHIDRDMILPRDRVEAVLDPGSPFLELGELAGGPKLYEGVPAGASLITGVGLISGRPCMIIANEATVKGGTYYGMTTKKHCRAQQYAWKHRLPCITFVNSGGAFLPEQPNIFPDYGQFGTIFHNQIGMSADGIPQIAVVMGSCTAGGAYIPALCDEVVIVKGQGFMYLGGPELTFAATGEKVGQEELGGADMHCRTSGVTDHMVDDDTQAIALTRQIIRNLGPASEPRVKPNKSVPPKYDPQEIYGIVSRDVKIPTDNREIVARLIDGSEFHEFKPEFGDTLITGFARIHGHQVGILANNGVLFSESAVKATHFINLCCQREIPLLFLADINGFMVGRAVEQGGICKDGAKMVTAMSSARVPKYCIVTGGSYGAGYFAMCGRPFEPTAMFAWPNGRMALMGPEQAASVLWQVRQKNLERDGIKYTKEDEEALKAPIREEYEAFQDAYNFAANLWVDGVIAPDETREVMGLMLDLANRVPDPETRFGVFRF